MCSFCPSWIQTQFLQCSFSHPAPPPALCLSSPAHLPLSAVAGLPCCAHRKSPGDTPAVWHLPVPLSPSSHPPGCPGSVLAAFDGGVTTVRTSSTLGFHDWEQVGRGEAPAGGVCSPPAHLEPQLPSGVGSNRGGSSLQRKLFRGRE